MDPNEHEVILDEIHSREVLAHDEAIDSDDEDDDNSTLPESDDEEEGE